jgi:hypothetical protein
MAISVQLTFQNFREYYITLFLKCIQLFNFKLIVTNTGGGRNTKNTASTRYIKFYFILLSSRLFLENITIKI